MLRFILSIFLLASAVSACKGGGESGSSDSKLTEDEFRWMAAQAVNAALLTENDLPANFDLVPEEADDDDDDPPLELTGACAEFNEMINADGNFLAAVAEAENGDFEDPNEDSFSSSAGAFRDTGAAEEDATRFQRFVSSSTCIDQFKTASATYTDELAAAEGITVTTFAYDVEEIAVPAHGDWAHGARMSLELAFSDGRGVAFTLESLSVRDGRMVGNVVYSYSDDPDFALRDAIFETIAARLSAEDARLPG